MRGCCSYRGNIYTWDGNHSRNNSFPSGSKGEEGRIERTMIEEEWIFLEKREKLSLVLDLSVNRLDDLHEECKRDVCRRMFNNPFFLIYIKSVHEKKINIRYL